MSRAPSRSSSVHPPPRSSTPLLIPQPHTHGTAHVPPVPLLPSKHEHTTKISHKLLHLFDHAKTANFHGTVIIHELANVPQLEGDFSVSWKFRGRRPAKGKDHGVRGKPSLPNLKMKDLAHNSPSVSSVSLVSSSAASSPATSTFPSGIQTPQPRSLPPVKAGSLPLTSINPSRQPSSTRPQRTSDPPRPEKKGSDPTPLKQSILPPRITAASPEPQPEQPISTSPESLLTKHDESKLLHPDSAKDFAMETPEVGPSSTRFNKSLLPPAMLSSAPGSAASSSSHLSIPFPRAPARSGTGPSMSTIIDSLPGKGDSTRPKPPSRTPSMNTIDTKMTRSSSNQSSHGLTRHRSLSGPAKHDTSSQSSSRKGTTPIRSLKAHTCTWNHEIQHDMRISLGKPVQPSSNGSSTPRLRHPAPVLGAGPLSDSGIRLMIEQLPSAAATNSQPATSVDKESFTSMLHAAHHASHSAGKEGKANPSEKGGVAAEKQKTVFGVVDIDLAAFAGKGKMTRRFLLRGSRTNATIKLTVDMRWIGGDETWAAPPMQEGHHVTGMNDLLGGEQPEDRLKADLNLAKTPSNSSSASSMLSGHANSNPSGTSSANMSANISTVSLAGPAPQIGYKSYEHHLRPTPDAPDRSKESTPTQSLFRRHTHRHRSHHSRHFKESPTNQTFSTHDLSPDIIIEAVFNPHASTEESPFTFVPRKSGLGPDDGGRFATPQGVIEHLQGMQGGNVVDLSPDKDEPDGETPGLKEGGRLGWGLRAKRGRKDKRTVSTPL